ncbi:hypothetical protein [Haloparvum sp. PAK95]|uniref:hypothetical protein n=1 Tax=Haloparvum sp. PAK95 TaxID=3418962 RepID=UPI003D2F214F
MPTDANEPVTDTDTEPAGGTLRTALQIVAVQGALLSAAVHLLWAVPRLANPADARPYLFVAAAVFTLAIAVGVYRAGEYRRLYALGAGTLATFLVGFLIHHRGDVAGALAAEPIAVVGKVAEVVGVGAFLALYRLAPPTHVVLAREDADES